MPSLDFAQFLRRLVAEGIVSPKIAGAARQIERRVSLLTGMPEPRAAPGLDGDRVCLYWDYGPKHLEIDAVASGPSEWFYRDRDTGRYYGGLLHNRHPGLPWRMVHLWQRVAEDHPVDCWCTGADRLGHEISDPRLETHIRSEDATSFRLTPWVERLRSGHLSKRMRQTAACSPAAA